MPNEDIDTLKAELERTRLAYRQAIQTGQLKAGFLARTSHELRSPLNSLIGLHQLIMAGLCENPEEEREFIEQAHQAAFRLLKLLDEVIYIAKLEYGSHQLEIETHPLSSIFQQVEQQIHLQAANRSYPLTITQPESELFVKADFKRLVQVLISLLDAGIAKMQEGSLALTAQDAEEQSFVEILIDIHSPYCIWSEPLDKMQEQLPEITPERAKTLLEKPVPSPEMNWILSQDLLASMKGQLNLVATPTEEKEFTRLRCLIPRSEAEIPT
ncbi:HAMP domain-containing sensor histidine kinase [Spirulina sp. CS-785/01]|uniref:sensor histidine kinase n=1 Tax=Spirulina sp. CS-785/01 TaxID=3021716 RepID=UPI00232CD132|nr:HAMP domain-containing sensor histidine kinase [Spirulina sp. CS-785/01]MDB9312553.1 HAMP domain-containing sensor histidine kinase [Spirulina sp. CS-785/01]